jgi:hypothetical protein
MKTISLELVEEVWDRVNQVDERAARKLADRMQKEQPFIMMYLLAAAEGEEPEGRADRGRLIELGLTAWQVMATAQPRLGLVSGEELLAAEQANVRFLEKLDDGPEAHYQDAAASLFRNYNQMPLLGAMLEALMSGNEDTPELADDLIGLDLLHLKTVIDCLDQ